MIIRSVIQPRRVTLRQKKLQRGFTIVVADTEQKEGLSSAHTM
jgi:hypothetical protein